MKELSIEQKAKAYDEAIKRAKAMIPVAANQEEIYNSVITIFPELNKESEDERIFEEIYKDLHTYYMMQRDKFVLTDIKEIWDDKWSKAKAWLEKQGEQKPAWSEEDEDILNTIINHFKVDIECTDEDDMVRWLKSLKERFNK